MLSSWSIPRPRSTVLTEEQEAVAVAFRKQTLLPLDDCLYTLQATMPRLTRSALHRCFERHGVSRLPEIEVGGVAKKKFKQYPIGYFHLDIAEVRTEQGKLYLFVAIDRTSKFSYAQLHERATRRIAGDFLRAYNFAKRFQTLKGLTPYQFICRQWQKTPLKFNINPLHPTVERNI